MLANGLRLFFVATKHKPVVQQLSTMALSCVVVGGYRCLLVATKHVAIVATMKQSQTLLAC
jgi:predicted RNA polymerase sigma factor